jgi:hypothetical protein
MAVIRLCTIMTEEDSDQVFTESKLVIKELLFNGANRDLLNNDQMTAYEIAQRHQSYFSV